MHLSDLLSPFPCGVTNPYITGLSADSRNIRPGFLFAALLGARCDGRLFIEQALAAGAAAILAPLGTKLPCSAPLIAVAEPRFVFAKAAARFYGQQPKMVAAVTGTNGKTSVAWFTRQIWQAVGYKAAALGTLGLIAPDRSPIPGLTTPDPVFLHETLRDLAQEGVDRLILEASSHGLEQYRLDGVTLSAAAFTNLSQDHLDYHGNMAAYFSAKIRLFSQLLPIGGTAVLNAASNRFLCLRQLCSARGHRILSYGVPDADLALRQRWTNLHGQSLAINIQGVDYTVDLPVSGGFQAENALAALGLALATGVKAEAAVAALTHLTGAPGRLQHVADYRGGAVYVDFAHSPDALETVLRAVRAHSTGVLCVVFGCGGDRDRAKRPIMGEIACRFADRVIVTDDNPRNENPAAIRADILKGCPRPVEECDDRARAIARAIAFLGTGDALVIAGKGHEQGQKIGETLYPFDDAKIACAAIRAQECQA